MSVRERESRCALLPGGHAVRVEDQDLETFQGADYAQWEFTPALQARFSTLTAFAVEPTKHDRRGFGHLLKLHLESKERYLIFQHLGHGLRLSMFLENNGHRLQLKTLSFQDLQWIRTKRIDSVNGRSE